MKGRVTFLDGANTTTAPEAVGVPATPRMADDFRSATAIRQSARELSVLPAGLTFAPKAGMFALWEGGKWAVLGVNALNPGGKEVTADTLGDIALFRVTLQK